MTSAPPLPGPAWLFCPADRPDRYRKALAAADLAILDLEDAVSAGNKEGARHALVTEILDEPQRVMVRVNPADTVDHAADLAALKETPYVTVMLPKAEHPDQLRQLADRSVVALLETPAGVVNAASIAAVPCVAALMWGAEDLVAAMGGRSSRFDDGRYRDVARHARATTLLAAHAAGRQAVDAVYLDIADTAGLAAEAADAVASGFAYKACIHPRQADVVRAAFRPGADMVRWARRVLEAARDGGVVAVDGTMVDAPLVRQAERVLEASEPGQRR